MATEPVLEVADLCAAYGRTPVLRGVDMTIAKGEIVSLIGRNGVGKTTTMRCLIGLLPATSGQIVFLGQSITELPADERARLGIGYIPQGRQVFPRMTVEENIAVSLLASPGKDRRLTDLVYQYFPILKQRRRQSAGTLSGGEQQQLAIGRALVGNPRLMLLDEPSEGIQPSIVDMICEVLKSVRDQLGTTILFVEQNLDTILAISERCYVIDKGAVVAEIGRDRLRTPEVVRHHLLI
ncbi:ABC transporter ATP-binding protein [Reyranella soli]|uniref:ABC transporter ATP-binding protein n=1 Tax=Reyranella soli TaxID=1230389 RepID=A0A512NJE8_9HYPH|nr:ABC transporter ATP-binding protein [Reyranella soli]GEP59066.1 ABC transporter ATP-binding protein [Reyranella soli]